MSFRGKFVGYFSKKYHDEIGYDSLRHQIEDALENLRSQLWDAMEVSNEVLVDKRQLSIKFGELTLVFEGNLSENLFVVKLIDPDSGVRLIDTLRSTEKGITSDLDKVTFDAFGDKELDVYLEEAFEDSITL
ncbi:hypothetical protein SAMN04487895_12737 [Paenibacillus sophorae]|uniref:Uncharacterized protein n=1 Tax=Paenibacillus sophorae TaxID=1333845 RepID=A0A1H8VT41_9BACL|nr:hypothetical protein [Paenibacillus sophorae]QWU15689.1 hypothetical protein KP014_28400 [Paenibacillus sophorae]SEP18460.1 hypothetical protein SAMN04487895_12737 [Paenibacillus sophorae]